MPTNTEMSPQQAHDMIASLLKRCPELMPERLHYLPYGFNKVWVWKLKCGTRSICNKYHIDTSVAIALLSIEMLDKLEMAGECPEFNFGKYSGGTIYHIVKIATEPFEYEASTRYEALIEACKAVMDEKDKQEPAK